MSSPDPIITRIVIRRNQSLSWQGLGVLLTAGLAMNLAFVLAAGIAGWWPVAGFVAAVFLVLAGTLLGLALSRVREVVTIHAHMIVVEYGRRRAETRTEMDRYWARVERCESPRPALMLGSRGVTVEVGRALGDTERKALERRLRGLVGSGATPEADWMAQPGHSAGKA